MTQIACTYFFLSLESSTQHCRLQNIYVFLFKKSTISLSTCSNNKCCEHDCSFLKRLKHIMTSRNDKSNCLTLWLSMRGFSLLAHCVVATIVYCAYPTIRKMSLSVVSCGAFDLNNNPGRDNNILINMKLFMHIFLNLETRNSEPCWCMIALHMTDSELRALQGKQATSALSQWDEGIYNTTAEDVHCFSHWGLANIPRLSSANQQSVCKLATQAVSLSERRLDFTLTSWSEIWPLCT